MGTENPLWLVEYCGSGYGIWEPHDTEESAYATARANAERASRNETVVITQRFGWGRVGKDNVGSIQVLDGTSRAHSRTWRRNGRGAELALTPLPADFWA